MIQPKDHDVEFRSCFSESGIKTGVAEKAKREN
jgi:hypothetical protein